MPILAKEVDGYTMGLGMLFVFNLIVGTGALNMPYAFWKAGWICGTAVLILLCFMSYITVTFVIEAMAIANAMIHWRAMHHIKRAASRDDIPIKSDTPPHSEELLIHSSQANNQRIRQEHIMQDELISSSIDVSGERVPLLLTNTVDSISDSANVDYFNITESLEMSKMASMFFNKWGLRLFFMCLVIYLYGDQAIYATTVSSSLRDVLCTYNNSNISDSAPCWEAFDYITRMGVYRIILACFFLVTGPFTFFNVQKTKYLQVVTSLLRWISFAMMIILALIILIPGEGQGHPSKTNLKGIPQLFGVSVYSFMCHHSVPSLIAPIRKKRLLNFYIALDYVVILTFYLLLSLTAVFTFPEIFNIYTLNFKVNPNFHHPVLDIPFIQYFLALFPVFTLSANFPIISITLCNNLKSLILNENKPHSFFLNRIAFPLLSLIPPLLICMVTNNLSMLVGYTGSYAGAGVQYVIPALLVYRARKDSLQLLGLGVHNKHASPFWHNGWIVFVLIWTVICIVLVTIHHIYTGS